MTKGCVPALTVVCSLNIQLVSRHDIKGYLDGSLSDLVAKAMLTINGKKVLDEEQVGFYMMFDDVWFSENESQLFRQ